MIRKSAVTRITPKMVEKLSGSPESNLQSNNQDQEQCERKDYLDRNTLGQYVINKYKNVCPTAQQNLRDLQTGHAAFNDPSMNRGNTVLWCQTYGGSRENTPNGIKEELYTNDEWLIRRIRNAVEEYGMNRIYFNSFNGGIPGHNHSGSAWHTLPTELKKSIVSQIDKARNLYGNTIDIFLKTGVWSRNSRTLEIAPGRLRDDQHRQHIVDSLIADDKLTGVGEPNDPDLLDSIVQWAKVGVSHFVFDASSSDPDNNMNLFIQRNEILREFCEQINVTPICEAIAFGRQGEIMTNYNQLATNKFYQSKYISGDISDASIETYQQNSEDKEIFWWAQSNGVSDGSSNWLIPSDVEQFDIQDPTNPTDVEKTDVFLAWHDAGVTPVIGDFDYRTRILPNL